MNDAPPKIIEITHSKKGLPKLYLRNRVLYVPADQTTVLFAMTDGTPIHFFSKAKRARAYISVDSYVKMYPSKRDMAIALCAKVDAKPLAVEDSLS